MALRLPVCCSSAAVPPGSSPICALRWRCSAVLAAFLAALAAAVAFGIASVVQEAGARRPPARARIGFGLVADLARQPLFLLGIALDAGGFVLTFLALRRLPLFAVES